MRIFIFSMLAALAGSNCFGLNVECLANIHEAKVNFSVSCSETNQHGEFILARACEVKLRMEEYANPEKIEQFISKPSSCTFSSSSPSLFRCGDGTLNELVRRVGKADPYGNFKIEEEFHLTWTRSKFYSGSEERVRSFTFNDKGCKST